MKVFKFFLFFIFIGPGAEAKSFLGCKFLGFGLTVSALSAIIEPETSDQYKIMYEAYKTLCAKGGELVEGLPVAYANGTVATVAAGITDEAWYYSNGTVITSFSGRPGSSWYYPNGEIITNSMGKISASWYYPNGELMTEFIRKPGATWYYPNGEIITNYAAEVGAIWYYPNGEYISTALGEEGSTWYHANGHIWLLKGPKLEKEELTDVAKFVLSLNLDGHSVGFLENL